MNLVLAASIALLIVATAQSLRVLQRSRDPRVWLLVGLLLSLGGAQGVALWTAWEAPLAMDPATAGAFTTLSASALAIWVVRSVGRTLSDLDRAEALHWRSMEAVRQLAEVAEERGLDLEARSARLLEIGCRCFGLEIGIRSRVAGDRYEVAVIRAPEGLPIRAGTVLPLAETWCRSAVVSRQPVDVARIEDASPDAHPGRSAFPFSSYLGIALRCADQVVGTLAFASTTPRATRFTASEKDVLTLMARWVEFELELDKAPESATPKQAARDEPVAAVSPSSLGPDSLRPPSLSPPPDWEQRPIPALATHAGPSTRSIDLNGFLRRLEPRLERAAGDGVRLTLELEAELAAARDPRLPLDAVITSLVRHAALAMDGSGEIHVSTADLELAGGETDIYPAVAPDRYVTLRVRDTAAGVDGEALARLFDEPEAGADGPIPFARLYRMLQGCGGDLSVEAEPGRGSTWTVFLPRADRSRADDGVESTATAHGITPQPST